MLRRSIFPRFTARARIARAPIATTPAAVAPTAFAPRPMAPIAARLSATCAPEGERFDRLTITRLATRVFVRISIAFSLLPVLLGYLREHDATQRPRGELPRIRNWRSSQNSSRRIPLAEFLFLGTSVNRP